MSQAKRRNVGFFPTACFVILTFLAFLQRPTWLTRLNAPPQALPSRTHLAVSTNEVFVGNVEVAEEFSADNGRQLQVEGWAVATRSSPKVQEVIVLLDGTPVATTMPSIDRPDVAEAYGRVNFLHCGWRVEIPLGELAVGGSHQVSAEIVGGDSTRTLNRINLALH